MHAVLHATEDAVELRSIVVVALLSAWIGGSDKRDNRAMIRKIKISTSEAKVKGEDVRF